MTATTCVRCGAAQADTAYACRRCGVDRPAAQLADIRDMAGAARDVAHRLASHDAGAHAGKPGSRLPFDLGATARLDAVQNTLTTWCRHIASERGIVPPWVTTYGEPITAASGWLSGQGEWMRHRPEAAEYLGDVEACARIVTGIARGPAAKRYLGPCGAPILGEEPCDGDVYGRRGATKGWCEACDAEVDQAERAAWLDAEVRQHAYRASEIEDAYQVSANLIRQWATPARGLLTVHAHDRQGRALYLLAQVLDVAAQQAAKRAEAQARRARKTGREAGGEAA